MAKYCPNCGRKLPDNAVFCDECGTNVAEQEHPAEAESPAETIKKRVSTSPRTNRVQRSSPDKDRTGSITKLIVGIAAAAVLFFGGLILYNKLSYTEPPLSWDDEDSETINDEIKEEVLSMDESETEEAPGAILSSPDSETSSGTAGTADTQPEASQSDSSQGQTSQGDVSQGLSAPDGNPTFEEFGYDELFNVTGLPLDRVDLPYGMADGEWKYFIAFNSNIPAERIDEIGLAEVGIGDGTCTMVWHPQQLKYPDGVVIEESDETVGYRIMTGRWDDSGMTLQGNNLTITVSTVYTYQGKDYLLASILSESGMICDLMMVRP